MDNNFKTQDIKLATYLKTNGVKYIGVEPVDQFNSTFIFDNPSSELLTKWFNDSGKIQLIIDAYRTLLREARTTQRNIIQERI